MINFNRPLYDNEEIENIENALKGVDYIKKVREELKTYYHRENLYLTSNGSSAMDMAFALMDLQRGAQVIVPSFNYPSIGNTILRCGLELVFADVAEEQPIIDIKDVIKKTSNNTKSIVPVHYGGLSVDMNRLIEYANERGIFVLEDAALSIGAAYKEQKLGTIGDMGIISFDRSKNISADKGGLLIINNENFAKNASYVYYNGTDKEDFDKGKADNYSWKAIGTSGTMSNVHAAILHAQINKMKRIMDIRKSIYEYYKNSLSPYTETYNFSIPEENEYNKNNYHVFYITFENNEIREKVRLYLSSKEIYAHTHYVPLHMSSMGKSLGYMPDDLPNSKALFENQLRLPLHNLMSMSEAERVVEGILEAL